MSHLSEDIVNNSREEAATKKDLFQLKRELLSKLATKEELDKLATKEELKKLATKDELIKLATKDELKKLATRDELKKLATKDELKKLATKDELKKLATKEDQKKFLTIEVFEKHENKVFSELLRLEEKMNLFETKADADKKFHIIMKSLYSITARMDAYHVEQVAMIHALNRCETRVDDHEKRIQNLENAES